MLILPWADSPAYLPVLYILLPVLSLIISVGLLIRLWQLRTTTGAAALISAIAGVMVWSVGYCLEIGLPGLETKLVWAKLQYLGILTIPLAFFIFSLQFTGRGQWLTGRRLAGLVTLPVIMLGLVLTNEFHHWIWATIQLPPGSLIPLNLDKGWFFWIGIIYLYGLLIVAAAFFVQTVSRAHSLYRQQALIILISMSLPWVGNILYLTHLAPVDLTVLAFSLATLIMFIGFTRFGVMEIMPVAHDTVFNAMRDGVVVLNQTSQIVDLNTAAQKIFGPRSGGFVGKPITSLLLEWSAWSKALTSNPETTREMVRGRRTYTVRVTPVVNRRQQATGQLVLMSDITERLQNESQLRLQSAALEAAENGIVITDIEGTIEWVNPAFGRLTGYSREEALGNNPRLIKSGRHDQAYYQQLWKTILAGRVWRGEIINRRKDGSEYYEEMTITPVTGKDGRVRHFIAIKQDVTTRKLAEETLKQAHQEALEANRLKTQLLANVSHDLRTPLGAIIGYADMLHSGVFETLNAQQADAAMEIMDSANELLAFVNNLIGQAHLETGKIVLRQKLFDPSQLLEAARLNGGPTAKKKGLVLDSQVAPGFPEKLYGDVYWLRQIVINLVNNALKFTDQGSVTLSLLQPDAEHWAIEVTDTGSGIPVEAQTIIFEPFRQLDGSATRKQSSGSGLGLSIVKDLTALMGGAITLRSAEDAGSTFTITLPLLTPQEPPP